MSYPKRFLLQTRLFLRMLRDALRGRGAPGWRTFAAFGIWLVYLVSPIDFVPDFFLVIGLVDDASLFALCLRLVRGDLLRYAQRAGLDPAENGLGTSDRDGLP